MTRSKAKIAPFTPGDIEEMLQTVQRDLDLVHESKLSEAQLQVLRIVLHDRLVAGSTPDKIELLPVNLERLHAILAKRHPRRPDAARAETMLQDKINAFLKVNGLEMETHLQEGTLLMMYIIFMREHYRFQVPVTDQLPPRLRRLCSSRKVRFNYINPVGISTMPILEDYLFERGIITSKPIEEGRAKTSKR